MADNPYIRSVEFIKSAVFVPDYPDVGGLPEVAVAGRSNVGKSSLINKMVNRRRMAKVSNTPGRTQLLNFFRVNDNFVLCDLPGYGYAKVPVAVKASWGQMIETYLAERDPLRVLLLLVDIRRTPGEWESALIGWLSQHGRAVVPVVTKIDKLPPSKRGLAIRHIADTLGVSHKKIVAWSAVTGDGMDDLWATVRRFTQPPPVQADKSVTSEPSTPEAPASDEEG